MAMLELVTVEDARHQLRLDYDSDGGPDDPWLAIAIPAISEAVRRWLKEDWRLYLPARDSGGAVIVDSDGNPVPAEDSNGPIVHPTVRLAVLVELERQYRFRGGEGSETDESPGMGYTLGKGATALLTPLRKPTVA
jgi:hypothetical protein